MLDVLVDEALVALQTALDSLLQEESGLDPLPRLVIHPARIVPLGLGAYVGPNADPPGERRGRLLDALVHVRAQATDADALADVSTAVTHTLLSADPVWMRQQGLFRMTLQDLGPVVSLTGTGPGSNDLTQDLRFDVRFEYIKVPSAGEGLIETIPLGLDVVTTGPPPRPLLNKVFSSDPLADFEVFDDSGARHFSPSQWAYDAGEGALVQLSRIRGGANAASNPRKFGTALVLRPEAAPLVQNFALTITLRSASQGGIGLVFRWQDPQNYYYFLMEEQRGFRLMARRVANAFSTLTVDETQGFDLNTLYDLKLVVRGEAFEVYLDDLLILEASDALLSQPGRVGLFCRNNDQAFFYRMRLTQL